MSSSIVNVLHDEEFLIQIHYDFIMLLFCFESQKLRDNEHLQLQSHDCLVALSYKLSLFIQLHCSNFKGNDF